MAGGGRAGRGAVRPGARSLIGGASGAGRGAAPEGCAGGFPLVQVLVPQIAIEPPHWVSTVAERSGAAGRYRLVLLGRAVITAHVKTVMVELVTGYRGSTERGSQSQCRVEPPLVTWFLLIVRTPLSKLPAS